MKVKELIKLLEEVDQDALVVTRGYEGGVTSDISVRGDLIILLNVNDAWYYGEHEIENECSTHGSDFDKENGVMIG
jgi:hypothetical protein